MAVQLSPDRVTPAAVDILSTEGASLLTAMISALPSVSCPGLSSVSPRSYRRAAMSPGRQFRALKDCNLACSLESTDSQAGRRDACPPLSGSVRLGVWSREECPAATIGPRPTRSALRLGPCHLTDDLAKHFQTAISRLLAGMAEIEPHG